MRMFGLLPRGLRKIFAEASHHACILPLSPKIERAESDGTVQESVYKEGETTRDKRRRRKRTLLRVLLQARRFRRNGVAVPAQRYHRSGATVSPFRRNGITVPAQRYHRSGATGKAAVGLSAGDGKKK